MSSSRLFLDGMLSSSARLRFARPRSECVKVVLPVEKFAANGELSLNCLSHPRGQPHVYITKATNSQGTHPKYVLLRIASRPGHVPAKVIQPRDASLQASGGSRRLLLALSCVAQDGASSV